MEKRFLAILLFAVLFMASLFSKSSFADGLILPPLVVQTLPDMPRQRALIEYRGGVEKLLVESSFQGEGDEMAWIVPVPAQPTEIGKGCAGIFNTLDFALQPQTIDSLSGSFLPALFLLAWGGFLLIAGRFVPFRALLMAILLCSIVIMGIVRGLYKTAGSEIQVVVGVKSSGVTAVGNYDVQILEADFSGRFEEWLSKNGFHALPEAGSGIVDDYIAKGWKFVVARLRREGAGFSRPHPLSISFPAAAPVYPMRLTQLSGSNLHLDLFVISDRQAAVDGMETAYSDAFEYSEIEPLQGEVRGKAFFAQIGLPSLVAMMKEPCVLTWLWQDLSNNQLAEDFPVRFVENAPFRRTLYTKRGAVLNALEIAAFAGGIILLLGAFAYRWYARKGGRPVVAWLVVLVASVCAAGVGMYGYGHFPLATIWEDSPIAEDSLSAMEIVEMLQSYPDILSRMTVAEVETYFRDALKGQNNPWTGEAYALEEQLGDIVVSQDAYGIVAQVFSGPQYSNAIGLPYVLRITGEDPSLRPPETVSPEN